MSIFCAWMAALIISSAVLEAIIRQDFEYIIEFFLGVAFAMLIWIALT